MVVVTEFCNIYLNYRPRVNMARPQWHLSKKLISNLSVYSRIPDVRVPRYKKKTLSDCTSRTRIKGRIAFFIRCFKQFELSEKLPGHVQIVDIIRSIFDGLQSINLIYAPATYLIHGIFHSFLNAEIHQGVTKRSAHVKLHRQVVHSLECNNNWIETRIFCNTAPVIDM